jgi:hypothetical protein
MGLISYTKIKDGDNATGGLFNSPLETIYNEFNGNVGSVNIQNNAITGAKIADSTITPAKIDTTQKFTFVVSESTTSTATLTPTTSKSMYILTAQAATVTINAPTGTPLEGQTLMFRFKDNGTARTLTWNAIYRAVGVTLPTATVANKTVYIGCIWNATESKWDAIAVARLA